MKKIALFGGSFNPPHPGHFEMAKYILETIKADEVWFLFSVNWQKDPTAYASMKQRMEMGEIMKRHYTGMPFVMSDIQEELGTHITYDVLSGLKNKFPDHHFTWVMGADNLASFHTWEHYDQIIENFPVAIVDRPGYSEKARESFTALTYPHLKIENADQLAHSDSGWCFLDNPRIDVSSSNLLVRLRAGQRDFEGPFQDVADYIIERRLYGVSAKLKEPELQRNSNPTPEHA